MILAFFAVVIGWIGMPGAIIPHANLFGDFLAPIFPHTEHAGAESHWLELGLMVFSVLVAIGGIRLAYSLYVKNTSIPDRIADRFKGTYNLLLNKYKVDELYNYIFVDGLVHKTAKFLYTIGDVKIIDGFINGLAGAISSTSQSGRKLQTGYVQQYAFTMGLGLVVLVGLYYIMIY
jgi:NADH-quinone oxidoreductase subunit L